MNIHNNVIFKILRLIGIDVMDQFVSIVEKD